MRLLKRVPVAGDRGAVLSTRGDPAPLAEERHARRSGFPNARARAALRAGLALTLVLGCERSTAPMAPPPAPMAPQDAAQRLVPVWQALAADDAGSFERAMETLKAVPPEAFRAAVYTVHREPDGRDVIKLDQTDIQANPAWLKRAAINFLEHYAKDRPAGEVLEQYERLDALLEGVLRSASAWTARFPSGQLPEALTAVSALQGLLVRNMLKSDAVAERPESRARLERRQGEIDDNYFDLCARLVTPSAP